MANIDLGNLTRYDGKIKQYTEDKYLSKNTANWQMTEKAGAVTCYPVPDTELEPIVDFSFKEIPPVSGDKSPSNPSTIEGVNSITLTRCGKNLAIMSPGVEYAIHANNTYTYSGITYTPNIDGSYIANGTATSDSAFYFALPSLGESIGLDIGKTYTLSGCPLSGSNSTYRLMMYPNEVVLDVGNGATFTSSVKRSNSYISIKNGVTVNNLVFKPQIELGSIVTTYEAPLLPSQAQYTYQLGNTYYGGSVNLAAGLMTVTHGYSVVSSIPSTFGMVVKTNSICFSGSLAYGHPSGWSGYDHICEELPFNSGADSPNVDSECWRPWGAASYATAYFNILKSRLDVSGAVDSSNPTDTEWLAAINVWLANNPLHCVCSLNTPYTVQLTPMQIKSLFALDKNTPRLNTLYTDADSIQVGYQKHPARTAYELENAILALGGGE